MSVLLLGGKKYKNKSLTGGSMIDMGKNLFNTALGAAGAAADAGSKFVKGTAAETTQSGGRRHRRSSRRRSSARSSKLRKRTGKVRRHATRSYRRTKQTRRA